MNIHRLGCSEEIATFAAEFVAARIGSAIAKRGRCTLALSGGTTPWGMMSELATRDLPWENLHVVQVDERVAPDGDPDRNLTHIREQFTNRIELPERNLYPMPVTAQDLEASAARYSETLNSIAGVGAVLDLVHLGLGSDGHTASLLPGDQLLQEMDRDVAVTPVYQGRRRMTLTLPLINRARNVLWLVTGAGKASMLNRLIDADPDIPAGRVNGEHATIITDTPADAGR